MKSIWTCDGVFCKNAEIDGIFSDRGFIYGHRVMTTALVQNNKVIDLERHLSRLEDMAQSYGLGTGFRRDVISFELDGILSAYPQGRAACRIYLTAGEGRLNDPIQNVRKWIQIEPLSKLSQSDIKLKTVMDSHWRRGPHIKTGLYQEQLIGQMKAKSSGFDDVLWCNSDQEFCETTTANIFLLGREGDLVEIATPPVGSGLLLGVTRQRIMELLNAAKIPVTERIIYKDELARFDEGFVTSSLSGLRPISQIDNHKLHSNRHQSVFTHIKRLYDAWMI
ncbi:MAG: aminotransferase class IV [Proteobacteria bacterium]|nr:aminotransferase class IV [Pseudomonadota bacterium]